MIPKFLALALLKLRLAKARARHSTVRFPTRDLPRLYAAFDAENIDYVVLRLADDVPMTDHAAANYSRDVDHLIGRNSIDRVLQISARQYGQVKCDYYPTGGQRGTAYLGMPYYMPEMAEQILHSRVRHPYGFHVPAAKIAFDSFLYHTIYHKGPLSGIESGLGVSMQLNPSRDYAAEVRGFAKVAGVAVPEPFTLRGFHNYLHGFGWNMAIDLLLRWPSVNPVIGALITYERNRNALLLQSTNDISVFVMREDGQGIAAENVAREIIASRFVMLREVRLDDTALQRIMFQTRGGNWTDKGSVSPNAPNLAFICRNTLEPGPLMVDMSDAKLKRCYPHVVNTDVLLKRVIRDRVRELAGISQKAAVLHATDNSLEALETLRAIYADQLPDILSSL